MSEMEEGGGNKPKQPGKIHAERVVKILEDIAECLGVTDATAMYEALTVIITSLKKNDEDFKRYVHNFVKLLIFKPGISANLMKQAVRGILIIKEYPDLVSPIFDMLAEKFPSFATMGRLDDEIFRAYLYQLLQGEEKVRHIRLMVVGMYSVGKTCLVRKICNKNIDDVKRTVGIDVHSEVCKVIKEDNWVTQETSKIDKKEYGKRLSEIVTERKSNYQPYGNDESMGKPSSEISSTLQSQGTEVFEKRAKQAFDNLENDKHPEVIEFRKEIVKQFSPVVEKPPETKNQTERKTTVSIWDFAGQSIYYSTHHFFLSSRSIYLLVLDISQDLDKRVCVDSPDGNDDKLLDKKENSLLRGCLPEGFTCGDAFRFWINSIYTYTQVVNREKDSNKQVEIEYDPKIVLVATHGDKLKDKSDKEKKKFKTNYFRKALAPFENNPSILNMICHEKFLVSCTEGKWNEFAELRKYIYRTAKAQRFWDEPVPAKWIPLERSIVALSSPCINLTKLKEIDGETEFPLQDETNIKAFLEFQHLLGNVLYYNVENLDRSIVLDPQWIIDIFKLFVTDQEEFEIQEREKEWNKYCKTAILDTKLIECIWQKKASKHVEYQEVIEFMKQLDVIAIPVAEKGGEPKFIVPCMLKKITREDANKDLKRFFQPSREDAKTTPVLCFMFENGFLPITVFHRLLASCIRQWDISHVHENENYLLYGGLGVFKLDEKRTLTIWYAEYVIFIRIASYSEELIIEEDCKAVKDNISEMLQTILLLDRRKRSVMEDKDVSSLFVECILCEKKLEQSVDILFKSASKNDLHKVEDLKKYESFTCTCSSTKHHKVNSSESLKYWYPLPSDRDLAELSDDIGEEYRKLGSILGFTQGKLQEIEMNPDYSVRSKSYKILIAARNEKKCTYDDLKKAIRKAKSKFDQSTGFTLLYSRKSITFSKGYTK